MLGAGSFDINGEGLFHKSSFGEWRILWSEISCVEVGEMDGTLVLHGDDKRFILSPPGWWSGADKNDAIAFVIKQLDVHNLTPKKSRTAAYKIMKNTRIQ